MALCQEHAYFTALQSALYITLRKLSPQDLLVSTSLGRQHSSPTIYIAPVYLSWKPAQFVFNITSWCHQQRTRTRIEISHGGPFSKHWHEWCRRCRHSLNCDAGSSSSTICHTAVRLSFRFISISPQRPDQQVIITRLQRRIYEHGSGIYLNTDEPLLFINWLFLPHPDIVHHVPLKRSSSDQQLSPSSERSPSRHYHGAGKKIRAVGFSL